MFDIVDVDGVTQRNDASLRPNQVFAASLPHKLLDPPTARQVLEVVERELLTPFGLRTLSQRDPKYRGTYGGDVLSRDSAYHQGTVWPWLMGPFITAYVKVNGESDAARRQAHEWLAPLKEHLSDAGLGHVSEIFEGDPPHRPVGCIAQAWSVAEILRAVVENIYRIQPENAVPVPREAATNLRGARPAYRARTIDGYK